MNGKKESNDAPIKLDKKTLSRCGAGIRRILQMSDEEIIRSLEENEKRLKSIREYMEKQERKKPNKKRFAQQNLFNRTLLSAHPFLGAVFLDKFRRVMIRAIVNFGGNIDDLRGLSIQVRSQAHDIFTITATKQQIATLATQPATQRIRLPRKVYPHLRDSLPQALVDQVHALPECNEGQGIIVGVIDDFLDIKHHAFRDPGGNHDTRIRFMWLQDPIWLAHGESPQEYYNATPSTRPDFSTLNYGFIYDEAAINAVLAQEAAGLNLYGSGDNQISQREIENAHGTHTTGIAAGSGHFDDWTTAPVDIGAAPKADIVFVSLNYDDPLEDHIMDAIDFIFIIADHYNKPAVISMSLGLFEGPHDGETEFDQFCDAQLFSFHKRSLVISAGNENRFEVFRHATISSGQTEAPWILTPNVPSFTGGIDWAWVYLSIWYFGPELHCKVSIDVEPSQNTGWITEGNEFEDWLRGETNTNYRGEVKIEWNKMPHPRMKNLFFTICSPDHPNIDFRIELLNPGNSDVTYWAWSHNPVTLSGAVQGELTLSDFACGRGVLSVGACAKAVGDNLEAITDYSGRGPTLDGRIKPEITAIGGIEDTETAPTNKVQSAKSGPTSDYVGKMGTSMAAPLVAGSIALLFEENPNLNQDAIKALLTQTADRTGLNLDPSTPGYNPIERNAYGFGRFQLLDAYQHNNPLDYVDVWVRTAHDDYGSEPYPGECCCNAPETKVLTLAGAETRTLNWNQQHRVSIRIHNLGDDTAYKVKARIKYTRPWVAPDRWSPCKDPNGDDIEQEIDVPPLDYFDLEFTQHWVPKPGEVPDTEVEWGDHYCLLVELDHPNDELAFPDQTWGGSIKGTNNVSLLNLHIH